MVPDALDPWVRVQILVQCQLEHRPGSVPRNDDCARDEVHPDLVPPLSVRSDHLVLVGNPVPVPPEEGRGVVDAEDVDVLDFKPDVLDLRYDPRERARSITCGEDPTVDIESPTCDNAGLVRVLRGNMFRRLARQDPQIASWGGNPRPGTRRCRCRPRDRKPDARMHHNGGHQHANTRKSDLVHGPESKRGINVPRPSPSSQSWCIFLSPLANPDSHNTRLEPASGLHHSSKSSYPQKPSRYVRG